MAAEGNSPVRLDARAQQLLKVLVERYIREGIPVGSRTLSRDSGLEVSPATIRNIMSDLEDAGLVCSPHTSAGRIPTSSGLRFFVDTLLTVEPLETSEAERMRAELSAERDVNSLMTTASSMVSDITRLAGLVTLPRQDHLTLRQIEFLPLSERRVLAILVISDNEVQNRVLHTTRNYTPSELQQASNYLNSLFAGRGIREVREALLGEMKSERRRMDQMMMAAIQMADQAFAQPRQESGYVMAGQTNLMDIADLADTRKLRQIFDAFNEKQQILHLLDGALNGEGIQIFIGQESGYQVLNECSLVAAPYEVDGRTIGMLGVIGPTRMAYDRVIPIVDLTARLLSSALNKQI